MLVFIDVYNPVTDSTVQQVINNNDITGISEYTIPNTGKLVLIVQLRHLGVRYIAEPLLQFVNRMNQSQ